jgi:hypothetical protein
MPRSRQPVTVIVQRWWVGISALLLFIPALSESGLLQLMGFEKLPSYVRDNPFRPLWVVGFLAYSGALWAVALNLEPRWARIPVVLLLLGGFIFWLWVLVRRFQMDGVLPTLALLSVSAVTIGIPLLLAVLLLTARRSDRAPGKEVSASAT